MFGHKGDQDEYTSDGGGSIAGNTDRNRNKPQKSNVGKQKLGGQFKIDSKSRGKGTFNEYYNDVVCGNDKLDKRLNRAKLREFLGKRYKDGLANRLTSLFTNYFS